jgi:AmmeMemoRadiSam system protein A
MNINREQDDVSRDSGQHLRARVVAPDDAATEDDAVAEGPEFTSLARNAVETFVRERRLIKSAGDAQSAPFLSLPAACFVSIKTEHGELRGCIGTIEPACRTLAEEIITNAVSAATRDPRFFPVTETELPRLCYSVDVLTKPEPARFEDLDPTTYGVIVENEQGTRRGLLLPAIEGIETTAQQVEIAARKAGIAPGLPLKLHRFRVQRFRETRK